MSKNKDPILIIKKEPYKLQNKNIYPKRKYQRKKRNTQIFLTSSQEYSLRLSRFLQAGKPALLASLVASLDVRQVHSLFLDTILLP